MIEVGKKVHFDNVISLRKKMNTEIINAEMLKMGNFMSLNGLSKNGPIITAVFGVEVMDGKQVMDMEILCPVDKKLDLISEYNYLESFDLNNALYLRYKGNPANMQNSINKIYEYIKETGIKPISPLYNLQIADLACTHSLDDMIIDICVDVA